MKRTGLPLALLSALFFLSVRVGAEESTATDGGPEAPKHELTKSPVLKKFVPAPYPADAEKTHVAGSVLLQIDVGADGKATNVKVLEPAGHGFDEAAIAAVQQFEFEPAEIDHIPAPVRLTYRYDFVLQNAPPPPPTEKPAPGVVNYEGTLLERGTRAPIPSGGLRAELNGVVSETQADDQGRFQFKDLPPGKYKITALATGFSPYETTEEIRAGEATTTRYFMHRKSGEYEATVRAPRERKEVARRTLTLEEIQKIPGTQGDAIRVIQNLPGVARTPLGIGPLIVRGGRAGDTRTYIDGQLVPLLFHFGGIAAVINSDLMETLDFYPGNLPVRYGRSIAGSVDVNTRVGKKDRIHAYADISLTQATLFAEGPLTQYGSWMASVRRSYIDAILPIVFKFTGTQADFQVARFWDYQLKADFDFGKDQVGFLIFGSDDRLALLLNNPSEFSTEAVGNFSTDLGFHRLTASWKRKLPAGFSNRLALTFGLGNTQNNLGSNVYVDLQLDTIFLREDLTWKINDGLSFLLGADLVGVHFNYKVQGPPFPKPGQFYNPVISDQLQAVNDGGFSFEPALFLDAVWRPIGGLKIVPGIRWDGDTYIRRMWWDPRVSVFYEFTPNFMLKGAAGLFHQSPTPEKLTKTFGNPNLIEEGATQYGGGFEWKFLESWGVDLQVYYNWLYSQATRGLDLSASQAQAALGSEPFANSGTGHAYGAELLIRKEPSKGLFGWVALSVGQIFRNQAPGQPYFQSTLNQRFNLIAVASYKAPWELEFGARYRLTDGNTYSPLNGGLYNVNADLYVPLPSTSINTERLPVFSQLDIRVDRRWIFEQWILDVYIDVQNVLNTGNVESMAPNYDYTKQRPIYGLPIFPALGIRGQY